MADNLLVRHLAGSHAYGTNIATSDVDYRGIFCGDPVHVRTPFFNVGEATDTDEEDTKYFELTKYMKLALDCNPNVIETLWVHMDDIEYNTAAYMTLRDYRHELLSSKAAFTFSGYALSQLKRIKGHNKWINNPQPVESPKPFEFLTVVQYFGADKNLKVDLNDFRDGYRLIPYGNNIYGVHYSHEHRYAEKTVQLWDDHGSLNDVFKDDREKYGQPVLLVKWNREEYKVAKEKWDNYWTWKKNRNQSRGELEEQFGYDTKHAMHLVRLLRMGKEILSTGQVLVKRPDAAELLEIRDGAWSYDELVKYAESMDKEVREVLYKKTELRKKPDLKLAAKVLMEVQDIVWDV